MAKNGKAVLLSNFSLPTYDATHDEENWGNSISNYVFMSSLQKTYADSTYPPIHEYSPILELNFEVCI